MRRPAPGILAVFDERELMLAAVRKARADGFQRLTAYAPAYDQELVEIASRAPLLGIGPFATGAGVTGFLIGFGAIVWTVTRWPLLRLGGKPLIALPPFFVVAFEMLILFAAAATVASLALYAIGERPRAGAPYDSRFSDDSYGLWIECSPSRTGAVSETMRRLGATECRVS